MFSFASLVLTVHSSSSGLCAPGRRELLSPGPQVQEALSNVYKVSESFLSSDLPPLVSVALSSHCLVFLPAP